MYFAHHHKNYVLISRLIYIQYAMFWHLYIELCVNLIAHVRWFHDMQILWIRQVGYGMYDYIRKLRMSIKTVRWFTAHFCRYQCHASEDRLENTHSTHRHSAMNSATRSSVSHAPQVTGDQHPCCCLSRAACKKIYWDIRHTTQNPCAFLFRRQVYWKICRLPHTPSQLKNIMLRATLLWNTRCRLALLQES